MRWIFQKPYSSETQFSLMFPSLGEIPFTFPKDQADLHRCESCQVPRTATNCESSQDNSMPPNYSSKCRKRNQFPTQNRARKDCCGIRTVGEVAPVNFF